MLFATRPASAHQDPPTCFETGPAIVVSVFRANGTTGVVGSVSECETIQYRARLQKAQDIETICAFAEGTFSLTTPDGVVHSINADVPCIGGTDSAEGCTAALDFIESNLIPYTVDPADIVGGLITATAQYTGGVAHDSEANTAGVAANTPRSIPVVVCDDNNLCTTDICDPNASGAGACSFPPVVCNDNSLCTTEFCNPATGQCVFNNVDCDDNDLCTADTCDPATGCVNTPVVCNDNNACTSDVCNPATGQCVFTPSVNCDDNNLCTTDTCNPQTGQCSNVDNVTPTCDDNDACTDEDCNPATGQCRTTDTTTCNDNDICTDDLCNPATGQCEFTPDPTNDPSCVEEAICRTPGFWKTHGSVSDQVLDLGGGSIEVCGECINRADANSVNNASSVLEAMCISPRGDSRLQLVRQLTALALNCIISEFGADCSGDADLGDLFDDCNAACLSNTGVGDCIAAIDCFNNGGSFDSETGLCGESAFNCHEQPLPETIDQGPADTPKACNDATKNQCTVILDSADGVLCGGDSCP